MYGHSPKKEIIQLTSWCTLYFFWYFFHYLTAVSHCMCIKITKRSLFSVVLAFVFVAHISLLILFMAFVPASAFMFFSLSVIFCVSLILSALIWVIFCGLLLMLMWTLFSDSFTAKIYYYVYQSLRMRRLKSKWNKKHNKIRFFVSVEYIY